MSSSAEVRCFAQRPPGSGSARRSALVRPGLTDMLSHGVKRQRRAQTGTWHLFGCRWKSSFVWMSRRRSSGGSPILFPLLLLSLCTLHASFVFPPHSHTRLFLSAARPSCLWVSGIRRRQSYLSNQMGPRLFGVNYFHYVDWKKWNTWVQADLNSPKHKDIQFMVI